MTVPEGLKRNSQSRNKNKSVLDKFPDPPDTTTGDDKSVSLA